MQPQPQHTAGPPAVCFRHPDRATGLACSRCGRSACPECLRPAAVGQHCVECLANDGVQRAAAPTFGDRGMSPMVANPVVAKRPIATYGLIAANIAVFIACVAQVGGLDGVDVAPLNLDWSLIHPYVADGQWWRLLTAGFIHFSVVHLAVNMISLYILGRDLEIVIGIPRYLMLYFTALFGGSAAVMIFDADSRTGGASGAIYGLMGAMLIVVLRARVSPTPVIAIIGFNLVLSVTMPGISIAAHVGGLLFGAAAAAAILFAPQYVLSPAKRTPQAASRVGWIGLVALFVLSIALGVGSGLAG